MKNRSNDTGLYSFFYDPAELSYLNSPRSITYLPTSDCARGFPKRMGDPVPPLISPKSGPAGKTNRRFGTFALMGRLLAGLASVIYRGGSGDSYRGFSIN